MKEFWTDLKSFVTVAMIVILAAIIVCNLFGMKLDDNLLLLFTNLITAVFTYYFTKSDKKKEEVVPVEEKEKQND